MNEPKASGTDGASAIAGGTITLPHPGTANLCGTIAIRPARSADAAALAPLPGKRGYPADAARVAARLARIAADVQAIALVACRAARVCGLMTAHAHNALDRDEPAVQLTLRVSASDARGTGAGQHLVAATEDWSQQRAATRVRVTTAVHRAGAHTFYERLGHVLTRRCDARQL